MQLSELHPQFVIVIGGGGSGKNYWISKDPVVSRYAMVDVDEIKKTMPVGAAISQIKPRLIAAFEKRANVVHPTTASNLSAQENKIKLAKKYGYTVTVILISTPVEQAIAQVRKRVKAGGHDVSLDTIVASNKKAKENYDALRSIADVSRAVSNAITEGLEPSSELKIKAGSPSTFSPVEINAIVELIQTEGQVSATGLKARVLGAKLIAVAIVGAKVVGVGAIKLPSQNYRDSCFANAGVPELAKTHPLEMGWKVVLPEYRGSKLGNRLSEKLLTQVNQKQVFSTVRSTNITALTLLSRLGFTTIGKPFTGSSGAEITLLTIQ